jgi:TolB-like protein
MRNAATYLFLLLLILAPGYGQDSLKSIAVLEFEAKGVSRQEASTLTDRLRSELVRTQAFVQIERSKIEEVLKEQSFQMSGSVSQETLVEIGELLGAELVVVGSIGKVGSTYTIDLRVVDVRSAEIIGSYFKDHKGEIDGLLTKFTILAAEIASGNPTAPVTLESMEEPQTVAKVQTVESPVVETPQSLQMTAIRDANADFQQMKWMGYGGGAGCITGITLPPFGGILGMLGSVAAARIMDSDPPPEREAQIAAYDATQQVLYRETYNKELQRLRRKTAGQASFGGCCVGLMLIGSLTAASISG